MCDSPSLGLRDQFARRVIPARPLGDCFIIHGGNLPHHFACQSDRRCNPRPRAARVLRADHEMSFCSAADYR
ncbi:MAG: hypothetical protein ACK55Z_21610, partial [bacterium]